MGVTQAARVRRGVHLHARYAGAEAAHAHRVGAGALDLLAVLPSERRGAAVVANDAADSERHHARHLLVAEHGDAPDKLNDLRAAHDDLGTRRAHAVAPAGCELCAEMLVRVHVGSGPARGWGWHFGPLKDLWHGALVRQPQLVAGHVLFDPSFPVRGEVGRFALALDLDGQPADLGDEPAGIEGEL